MLADLPATKFENIVSEQLPLRRDFRSHRIYTIDPATAKDLDDAIHIETCADGTYEVGVHIADVSFFVRAASNIDAYAAKRGTTTYLTQYCLPMLPHTLSEELCSLNPKQDRLAFSVVWRFSPQGTLLHAPPCSPAAPEAEAAGGRRCMGGIAGGGAVWIGRSVIRSKCRLAYETAQSILDGKTDGEWPAVSDPEPPLSVDQVKEDVLALHSITKQLRAGRFQEGSVSITQHKVGFVLGPHALPIDIQFHQQREANQLVEELMLLANQTVARVIAEAYPRQALLRRHPEPLDKSLADLKRLCEAVGLPLTGTSSVELQRLMERVDASTHPLLPLLLRQQCAKSMQLAQYFSTGELPAEDWRHYALAMSHYTHFTSPIRRYPDIVVHRLLQVPLCVCLLAHVRVPRGARGISLRLRLRLRLPLPHVASGSAAQDAAARMPRLARQAAAGSCCHACLCFPCQADMSYRDHVLSNPRRAQAAIWRVPAAGSAGAGSGASGEGMVDAPLWDSARVSLHASHCNDMKWASKAAQEASTALFLRVYLDKHPLEQQDSVVTSLGSFSFTVFVPAIAQEFKVDHKSFTIPPTWTNPNRARQAASPLEVSSLPCLPSAWRSYSSAVSYTSVVSCSLAAVFACRPTGRAKTAWSRQASSTLVSCRGAACTDAACRTGLHQLRMGPRKNGRWGVEQGQRQEGKVRRESGVGCEHAQPALSSSLCGQILSGASRRRVRCAARVFDAVISVWPLAACPRRRPLGRPRPWLRALRPGLIVVTHARGQPWKIAASIHAPEAVGPAPGASG